MSFSFQFDDVELDDEYATATRDHDDSDTPKEAPVAGPSVAKNRTQGRKHPLQELVSDLPPRISYSSLTIALADSKQTLFRRDLFDARFQLINDDDGGHAEDQGDEDGSKSGKARKPTDWETYSAGADTDLIPGVYEGGFKTWECSLDLVSYLHEYLEAEGRSTWLHGKRISEVGCGTAIPCMYLLSRMFAASDDTTFDSTFEFCDYNEQVLRLVTLPNIFLNWYFHGNKERQGDANGEVELTSEILEEFQEALSNRKITLSFYSGPWDTLHHHGALQDQGESGNVVLTSETIYSVDSLPSLVETLERSCCTTLEADLRKATLSEGDRTPKPQHNLCLVAAKVLYFGVGGGVDMFKEQLALRHASSKAVWTSNRGVARVVLQVSFS